MKNSSVQSTLRASLFYVGSALFMATGAVTIADEPLGGLHIICAGCAAAGGGPGSTVCAGFSCWNGFNSTNCSQLNCAGIPAKCPC